MRQWGYHNTGDWPGATVAELQAQSLGWHAGDAPIFRDILDNILGDILGNILGETGKIVYA
jgi:hypothetical protein